MTQRKLLISSSREKREKGNKRRAEIKSLTFDFFIWNDRSKSSECESLFYFTSTGRKGVVIILCAHIQRLSQRYPSRAEKEPPKRRDGQGHQKTANQTFNRNGEWHEAHVSAAQIQIQSQTEAGSSERLGTVRTGRRSFIMMRKERQEEPPTGAQRSVAAERRSGRAMRRSGRATRQRQNAHSFLMKSR